MKNLFAKIITIGMIVSLNIPSCRDNRQIKAVERSTDHKKAVASTPMNDVPSDRFNRSNLVKKVARGDARAAFDLGTHYSREDLPEAALYWYTKAHDLGYSGVDSRFLEYYEHTIIGEFDSGPYDKDK